MLDFTLYSRPGCHLCEDMQADLTRLLGAQAFRIQVVDISGVPHLMERYGLRIPVLVDGNGGEVCQHRLDQEAILEMAGQHHPDA